MISGVDDFLESMEAAFEHYFDLHQKDPLINCIWSVVQTDADLQAIDIEDTLQNARYIQSVVGPMLPHVNAVSGDVDPRDSGGARRFCGNVDRSAGELSVRTADRWDQ